MEAEQYIPFDSKDIYLDFQRLPARKAGSDRQDIMLVAAKKEVVNHYLDMLAALKLNPVLVDVDGFALSNIWGIVTSSNVNVALIDIGASKMNINIIADGVSVVARDVAVGSAQLTNRIAVDLDVDYDLAEKIKLGAVSVPEHEAKIRGIFTKVCSQWAMEIRKAVDLYRSNNQKRSLSHIVLSGGGAKVSGLSEYIAKEIDLPVQVFDPFDRIQVDEKRFDRQFTKDFFIFNEPTQEYDPTHIHPYLIPRSKFRIPEVTGDKELDFEQTTRSEERRVGKECRSRWSPYH